MNDVAVITGVSRGIGRAVALKLAQRGLSLALLGRQSALHEKAVSDCAALGVAVKSYACDMAERQQIEAAARALLEEMGTPRVVVNNAARLERGPLVQDIDVDVWDNILAINLRGPFLLTRALLPSMLKAGRGRFLHVSSVSGTIGCPHMAHYGSSKWGLIGFHLALSDEIRGSGVQSIAILPGSVDTEMLQKTPFPPDMPAADVAEVMIYYALDAPDAVHGARVPIVG